MAFILQNLSSDASDAGPTFNQYRYITADLLTVVRASGYFNDVIDTLKVNDQITIVSDTGGTPVHSINIVLSNDGTDVDVSDGLIIPSTDTD